MTKWFHLVKARPVESSLGIFSRIEIMQYIDQVQMHYGFCTQLQKIYSWFSSVLNLNEYWLDKKIFLINTSFFRVLGADSFKCREQKAGANNKS